MTKIFPLSFFGVLILVSSCMSNQKTADTDLESGSTSQKGAAVAAFTLIGSEINIAGGIHDRNIAAISVDSLGIDGTCKLTTSESNRYTCTSAQNRSVTFTVETSTQIHGHNDAASLRLVLPKGSYQIGRSIEGGGFFFSNQIFPKINGLCSKNDSSSFTCSLSNKKPFEIFLGN